MNQVNVKEKNKNLSLGVFLVCTYIFVSYVANSLSLNVNVQRITLYLLLFWAAVKSLTYKIQLNFYHKWYLSLFAMSALSLTYANYKLLSLLYPMIIVLGLTYSFSVAIKKKKDFNIIFWIYSISATALFVILLATDNLHADERLGESIFGNANIFAHYFSISVVCSMWLLIYTNKFSRFIALICTVSQIYALALSGGRKTFISPFIFLCVLLLLKRDKKGRKHIIRYMIVFIFIVLIMYYMILNVPVLYESIGHRMESLANLFLGEGYVDTSTICRQQMVELGLSGWFEKPYFGHGIDQFKFSSFIHLNKYAYAHNNYIEILFDLGIIGFIIYYGFYLFLLIKLWNIKDADNDLRNFFISFLISLLIFEIGAITYNQTYTQIVLAMAAVYLSNYEINQVNGLNEEKQQEKLV